MPSSSSQAVPQPQNLPSNAPGSERPVTIGMIGLGTVGSGVFKIFRNNPDIFFQKIAEHRRG